MPEFTYTVERAEAEAAVSDYLAHCVDVPRFLDCCRQCPNYGTRWSCPPFDFDPMALWQRFQTLRLYARLLKPCGENRDGDVLIAALRREKPIFLTELLQLERGIPGSLALACGSCDACADCTRSGGEACRHPDRQRHSIESLGGDVSETAIRYFGRPLLWVQDGAAPDYLMMVGGLLLPGAPPCR